VKNSRSSPAPVAERFYALYREQCNPDLTVSESVVEEWISVGTFLEQKKKSPQAATLVNWRFAEKTELVIERDLTPMLALKVSRRLKEIDDPI
jgi:hypothetical protein